MISEEQSTRYWADRHLWQIIPIRDLSWILGLVGMLWMTYTLRNILLPVFIGLLLAYLFNPLIEYAQNRWHVPRLVTIIIVLVILIAGWVGLVLWLGPIVVDQSVTLAHNMPGYVNRITDRYDIEIGSYTEQLNELATQVQENTMSTIRAIFAGTGQAFDLIGSTLGFLTYLAVSLALIPMYFFFFAWHFPAMINTMTRYLPASRAERIKEIVSRMNDAVGNFFRGRLIIALLMALMFSTGWFLAGVPYWFLLGVGTGLLSLIPYAAVVGWPIAVLLKYLDMTTGNESIGFHWMAVIVWPSLVYILVQVLEGWVITPWIQSGTTDLSAVTILLVVFIGGSVGGILGLVLAIPVTACFKILLQEVFSPRLEYWALHH